MVKRMEKTDLDVIVGCNIINERKLRDITRDELAMMMGLTTSHMGLIERGERGVTAINFSKLSQVLGIPVDRFFAGPKTSKIENNESLDTAMSTSYKKLQSMATCLTTEQLNLVVHIIKGIIAMDLADTNGE